MEVRLLGPVELTAGGRPARLGRRAQRLLLVLLATAPNAVVPVDRIIDVLWEDRPPPSAHNQVQVHVAALRRLLAAAGTGREALATEPAGYLLRVPPVGVDLHDFLDRTAEADRALAAGRLADAGDALRSALGLWRGPALAGLTGRYAQAEAARLEQLRLAALERRIDVDLQLVRHADLVPELTGLVGEQPLHEGLQRRLVLALYQSGRTAEALATYQAARRALVDELGIEPGPALTGTEAAILRGEPPEELVRALLPALSGEAAAGPAAASPTAAGGREPRRPAQLPADLAGFSGRRAELAALDRLLAGAGRPAVDPTAVVITAISGTAGVGKTALAVHWAHRVADRFPDGQLYVNLRGFDPTGPALDPATAVRGFLDALGVPPQRIPADPDAQAGLYRSLLSGMRTLVVLDNARDAEHVRPLLPGTRTAFAVVTSRNALTGLLAADGAHPLTVDLLTPDDARQLLERRLGPSRVGGEPAAVDQIIAACARLPLALSIAAARAEQTGFPLTTIAAELADAGDRLGRLDAGEPATQVQAVFSWSYRALTTAAARLFRLLGLHPGADISTAAAASLTGLPLPATQRLLAELTRASLVTEHLPGRFGFHDLLRVYAADLAGTTDPDPARRAATTRLLDHYTHTAHTAGRLLYTSRDPILVPLTPPAPGTTPEQPADAQAALAWLEVEHPVLQAALRHATSTGLDTHTWQLAWALDTFLDRRGQWPDQAAAWRLAVAAADRLSHPAAAAHAHRRLAWSYTRLRRHPEAHAHLRDALSLYTEADDLVGRAHTHHARALLGELQDRPDRALQDAQHALALYRAAGHRSGQGDTLNSVGWFHAVLGDHEHALSYCTEALAVHQQLADRWGEANTWDSLGYAHHQLAHYAEAAACYQHALTLFRDLTDRYHEAGTLIHLGDTHQAAGRPSVAGRTWREALAILTDLDHPDADAVRAKLAALDRIAGRRGA